MYITYKKCSSSDNEMQYKNYKNKLTKLMKFAEKKYYQDKLEINKRNMKKTWGIIKEVIGKNKSNQTQSRFKSSDGRDITNKSVISEKFNDFFCEYWPYISSNIWKNKGFSRAVFSRSSIKFLISQTCYHRRSRKHNGFIKGFITWTWWNENWPHTIST